MCLGRTFYEQYLSLSMCNIFTKNSKILLSISLFFKSIYEVLVFCQENGIS